MNHEASGSGDEAAVTDGCRAGCGTWTQQGSCPRWGPFSDGARAKPTGDLSREGTRLGTVHGWTSLTGSKLPVSVWQRASPPQTAAVPFCSGHAGNRPTMQETEQKLHLSVPGQTLRIAHILLLDAGPGCSAPYSSRCAPPWMCLHFACSRRHPAKAPDIFCSFLTVTMLLGPSL